MTVVCRSGMEGHTEMESTLNQLLVEMDGGVCGCCVRVFAW